MTRHIFVDADWIPLDHPHSVGRRAIDRVRGKESMSFEYDAEWTVQNQLDVDADSQQLWRRIVFSIAIQNTDDHEFDNSLDFVLALEVAPLFRLDESTA